MEELANQNEISLNPKVFSETDNELENLERKRKNKLHDKHVLLKKLKQREN